MNTVTTAPFGAREGAPHGAAGGDGQAWSAFATAASDAEFCRAWLALQCAAIPAVRAGLLLLRAPGAWRPCSCAGCAWSRARSTTSTTRRAGWTCRRPRPATSARAT